MPSRQSVTKIGVAMIASDFAPSLGGIQTHTLRLAQRLVDRGARVSIVTRSYRTLLREERIGEVDVIRVGWGDTPLVVSTGTYVIAALRALRRRRAEIDVLHAHQMLSPMTIALIARLWRWTPIVINPHLGGEDGDVMQLVRARRLTGKIRLAAARRYGDAFVAISAEIARELCEAGIPDERIARIPNGIDPEVFRPADGVTKRALRSELGLGPHPLVLYSGRLAWQKGLDVLLDAWPNVVARVPVARLVLVGDGEQRAALESQAERNGITGSVRFVGASTNVSEWLRAADVFVLPSRAEGMSVSLMEAMACALPVVATAVGGTPEVLADGRNGRLVAPEDPSAIAQSILESLVARAPLGEAARADILARFSLDYVTDQYLALYDGLIKPHRRRYVC